MNYTILEAVIDAKNKTEAKLDQAHLHTLACEEECYELQALVMEAEGDYMYNPTDINACTRLDKAYNDLETAQRDYYWATDDEESLKRLLEILNEAEWIADSVGV